jgi:hypothetical protein
VLNTTRSVLKRIFNQPPPGYRPGATLDRAIADLRGKLAVVAPGAASAHLISPDGSLKCEIRERVERHFMMHIVSTELRQTVAAVVEPGLRIEIRNSGWLRRTGIVCSVAARQREAASGITGRIMDDPRLSRSLMALDFRRCCLESSDQGWSVLVEPYGASEVVSRMPSFRRYIRMDERQVHAVAETFSSFQRLLAVSADN